MNFNEYLKNRIVEYDDLDEYIQISFYEYVDLYIKSMVK